LNALEHSWYRRFGWSWLLLPLSALFALLSGLRRRAFASGLLTRSSLPAPVIVVGNISVGGTGKTPVTLRLCELLKAHGWRPGIISRGYGVQLNAPRRVSPQDAATDCGDEPLLLAQRSGCPVVIFPDRVQAGQFLLATTDCNIVICDDGLQHYRLQRDLEIVLIDASRGLGNGLLLPAGPLREGRWRLSLADVVLSNGILRDASLVRQTHGSFVLAAEGAEPLCVGAAPLRAGEAVHLVSGIGNPQRFAATAQSLGYQVVDCHWFADHHPFVAADLSEIAGPVLMTEKDAVKCRAFARPDWYYLPVQAVLPPAVEQQILQRLAALDQFRSH
jgi:tetraacyldisaccharide 4'-kinase